MHFHSSLQPLILISLLLLAGGLLFLVNKWPQGVHVTFSGHAAAQKVTIIYYIALFAIALPILFVFFAFWLVPHYGLSPWFLIFVGSSEVFQHIVTIIPEVGGWRSRWHRILTACSAILLVPALLVLASNDKTTVSVKAIAAVCMMAMLGIIAHQIFFSNKKEPRYLMLFQSGYYGAFFIAILAATFVH